MRVLLYPRLTDDMMVLAYKLLPQGIELVPLEQNASEDALVQALHSVDAYMGFIRPPVPSPRLYDAMAHLKLVQLVSAGYDRLDIDVMRRIRVPVASNGGANAVAVAEHTILLILAVYRNFAASCASTKTGSWRLPAVGQQQLNELAGKTVGLVGLGMIGREMAKRLKGFETTILYHDAVRADPDSEKSLGVKPVSFPELLSSSDVVSLHVPLLAETHHMIGREALQAMKRSAILINTCRGAVVDTEALYDALRDGTIRGAGLDTVDPEPPPSDLPLLSLPNVTVTPHIAGLTLDSWPKRLRNSFTNLQRVDSGQTPLWIVPEMRDIF